MSDQTGVVQGVLKKVLAVAASAVLLLASIAVSLIVFAFALAIVLVGGLILWWKTRDIRKHLRTEAAADGTVIEGEVIRKSHRPDLQAEHARSRDDPEPGGK
jgi:ABC-type phosphate transport system auxiliary subunit